MRFRFLAPALLALLALACGAEPAQDAVDSADAPAPRAEPVSAQPVSTEKKSRPRGRPLPAFSGWTLDDQKLEVSSLIGHRFLLFFFNPDAKEALPAARAMNEVAELRGDHNFEVVGIATGADRKDAQSFVRAENVSYRVVDDSSARLAQRFGLRAPVSVLGVDAEGYVFFGTSGFATEDPEAIEQILRQALRLPETDLPGPTHPEAPLFRATRMDGGEPFDLADHRGKPVVLIFFLHTCPHCHHALRFLKKTLAEMPEDVRPTLVGIEITGKTYAVRNSLESEGLDFFPVLFDDDGSAKRDYGVFGGVPDIFLIDSEGRINARTQGWDGPKHEPLMRMRLARLAGAPIPMLLRTQGYSGSEVCGVCHELEHETWSYTTHSSAFDTLVRHAADNDSECIGCHVVGWDQQGGFQDALATPDLENVGCESCHGRGGPHLSPDFLGNGSYAGVCVTCHDTKHSLGFEYSTFRPRISHAENAQLVALPPEEKARILAERGRPGGSLLPTTADFVGSDACESCHAAEFETWAASAHARSVQTLASKGKNGEAECLACHTTGFDRPGGFPAGTAGAAHGDLARVGCESCHGPGGNHVKEGAARIGSILSLGDKCDSCVIFQICGSCHDDANDPGFEFEVQEKIDLQRHGTIEPGTGRAKGATARGVPSDAELLARAFSRVDAER